jgi:hypothetical protein
MVCVVKHRSDQQRGNDNTAAITSAAMTTPQRSQRGNDNNNDDLKLDLHFFCKQYTAFPKHRHA